MCRVLGHIPKKNPIKGKCPYYISIVFGLAMLWTHRVSASPYAKLQAASQISPPVNLSLPVFEAPAASNVSSPPYICYTPGVSRLPITVEDCRDTLRIIRNMPDYRRVQEFQRDKKPVIPMEGRRGFHAPPFVVDAEGTICGLEISDKIYGVVDRFSFAQVRELATDIVEECNSPGKPGYGGQWPIGQNGRWMIRIFGIKEDPPMNVTSLAEVVEDNIALITNATIVPGSLDDANTTITMPVSIPATGQTS